MITGKQISYKTILKDVSFELKEGRITTFMGPSGAGKTTLLRCIANLHENYEGEIICQGKDLKNFSRAERASTIGFVLQQFHLFPHLTVLHNCTFALEQCLRLTKKEAEEKAEEILGSLGMKMLVAAYPAQLSGGQQQRVAIARALVLRPKVLLLDEPTSALDPESKADLKMLLLDLNAQGLTVGLSSHDMPFIRQVMDEVYFMENGEIVEPSKAKRKIDNFLAH